ncbi:hypothetical protein LTR99_001751 [Exophiala xenobiotica]|uniref:Xylanolytic transcriptional activator regulatory domain-containing protein n=1 Tax=Vermiconidia calcicola TaxID=1690605 RepID=A0AAV9Q8D8_9PEZI|nr:hypothetical protein LTR99_001751 [Exophiala xenobiotica]KAK5426267.1 hypothetical protein LTR34_010250 [Exophiala xenobiotica]KAK5536519.1 hypothetical protein LTR25_005193 [Vermiconidia calcicola]KAK5543340.1 hypothetical protein LTR23_004817 [Chaetothyriales sp. CCFEE 6169]
MESLLNNSGCLTNKDGRQQGSGSSETSMPPVPSVTSGSTTVPATTNSPNSTNHDLPTLDGTTPRHRIHPSTETNETRGVMDRDMNSDEILVSRSGPREMGSSIYSGVPYPPGRPARIGSAAGFSIFSPKGIQWVIEKTGNKTFKDAIVAAAQDEHTMNHWTSDTFNCVFTRRVYRQLPPKDEAISLVERYFKDFNSVCPLFSQHTFMSLLERQYSATPCESAGWWASLNTVLAIITMLQALDNAPPATMERSRDYFRNALAVFAELTIRGTDIIGVQALLAMALLMQGTPDPRPVAFFVASAMRLSHTLGMHKKESLYGLDPLEAEQRKRVFWIAYRIDKDMCIRSGLPLIQDEDDMNIELPSENPQDDLGIVTLPGGQGRLNMFRAMAEVATIQARIHKRLYSASAANQSDEQLMATITELDRQLEQWKEGIPVDLDQPDSEIRTAYTPHGLHLIVLHFSYYNCLHTIHRTSIQHSYWAGRQNIFESVPLNPQVFQSAAQCSHSARASIRMLKYIPVQDMGFVWRVLYFPVSAFITLFESILRTPTDSRSRSDLRLMRSLVVFLSKLGLEDSMELNRIFRVCSEFEKTARDVVERTERTGQHESTRGQSMKDVTVDKQHFTTSHAVPLTSLSATVTGDLGYLSPSLYSGAANQSFPLGLDDSLGQSQFPQRQPGLLAEIQPMFPDGLNMPWNGGMFHDPFGLGTFTANSYGLETALEE